jgi:hypothetical protein
MALRKISKKRRASDISAEDLDFSHWCWQDTERAPLPSVSSSEAPVVRWIGVQSLASIATGRDGKNFVSNAKQSKAL